MIVFDVAIGSLVASAVMAAAGAAGVSFSAILGLVALLAGAATVAGVVFGIKWKTNADVAHSLAVLNAERAATLEHERDDARQMLEAARLTIADAQKTIARLEALPNLQRVLELVTATFESLTERFDKTMTAHERRSLQRHREIKAELKELGDVDQAA